MTPVVHAGHSSAAAVLLLFSTINFHFHLWMNGLFYNLNIYIVHAQEPVQFAYRPHRGVEDATITLFNLIFKHLEGNGSHARLLFVDFSSSFNTIQPHILTGGLLEQFYFSNDVVSWILDFLTKRTQRLRINGVLFHHVLLHCSSTGSPQRCLLRPL